MKFFIRYLTNLILYFVLIFFLVFYFFFFLNLDNEKQNLAKEIELVVFLKEGLSPETIAGLGENLRAEGRIREVFYTSKDEALKQLQGNPVIKEGVTLLKENPLPASFTVFPLRFEEAAINELFNYLSAFPGVEKVIFDRDILRRYLRLDTIYRALDISNVVFLGLLLVLVVLIMGYFLFNPNKKGIIITYLQQLLLSLPASVAVFFLFSQMKSRFLKAAIFFRPGEIILLSGIVLIFSLFFAVFSFTGNE